MKGRHQQTILWNDYDLKEEWLEGISWLLYYR